MGSRSDMVIQGREGEAKANAAECESAKVPGGLVGEAILGVVESLPLVGPLVAGRGGEQAKEERRWARLRQKLERGGPRPVASLGDGR